MNFKYFRWFVTGSAAFALMVVMLGAYTRLTDAGLGCPDWPGCYGKLILPLNGQNIQHIETVKAWTEMAHRYVAGTLGLFILCITIFAHVYRKVIPIRSIIPYLLLGLVVFQAILGMWTVTMQLLPVVVMAHLLGGIGIFALLSAYSMQLCRCRDVGLAEYRKWRKWFGIGILLLFLQIALGGWVSANYAGISCIGFPKCNGFWFADADFDWQLSLFAPLGVNYQGGVLESGARAMIQSIHRLGALVVILYFAGLFILFWRHTKKAFWRVFVIWFCMLLAIQVTLGIINVIALLPLPVAVLHNGCGALLLASCCVGFVALKKGWGGVSAG